MPRAPSRSAARPVRTATALALILLTGAHLPASAEAPDADDQAAVIAELQDRIRAQEARLERLEALLAAGTPGRRDASPILQPAARPDPALTAPDSVPGPAAASRFRLSGDARLRYEYNTSEGAQPTDSRGVVRGRLAASYQASPDLELGARLVTGDPDDPNSADVSLSNFNDDLQVSLDRLYGRRTFGALTLTGGKFANPFRRTDLVWDGDVNLQGLAAQYAALDTGTTQLQANALLFPIERSVAAADSIASGLQLVLDHQARPGWKFGLAAGYYDYELEARGAADTGDTRTNRLDASGAYVSDYDLIDVIASAAYIGLGDRWPVQVQADIVQNLGADDYDTGYSVTAALGRASTTGDARFSYGYHSAEADAVFAAFAQDNIPYGSNYLQHTLSASYVLGEHLTLDATLSAYRVKDTELVPVSTEDWQQRLRLNLVSQF